MAAWLWQPVNPSFSFTATVKVSFSMWLVTLTLSSWCFCPRPLCVVLPPPIKGSPASHTWWNTWGCLAANRSRSSLQNEGWVFIFFYFFFLCAALSLQKQARCLNSFNVLCSSGFTATLVVTAATVYICARSPSTVNTGIPSILCPWVTIYYSSGPLLWHSWLIINHRRWAHMPAHMCYVWAPHRLYSSSSSAPNIHWLNNELGLLHRPLWPNECEKLAVKELGGGRDKALTLGSDSRVKQTVFYLQTMRTCSIFLDLNGPKQKVNRWSFCGDRRLNNGIQRRYFLKAPDSCSL